VLLSLKTEAVPASETSCYFNLDDGLVQNKELASVSHTALSKPYSVKGKTVRILHLLRLVHLTASSTALLAKPVM
jgi:hypothetical protein